MTSYFGLILFFSAPSISSDLRSVCLISNVFLSCLLIAHLHAPSYQTVLITTSRGKVRAKVIMKTHLIEGCSIGDLTGRLVQIQEDHRHPLTHQLFPQPEANITPSSSDQHLSCGDSLHHRSILSHFGGSTVRTAAAGCRGPAHPVPQGHGRTGDEGRFCVVDPGLMGQAVHEARTGLQATNGAAVRRELLHLAQRSSTVVHVGSTQLHRCPGDKQRLFTYCMCQLSTSLVSLHLFSSEIFTESYHDCLIRKPVPITNSIYSVLPLMWQFKKSSK